MTLTFIGEYPDPDQVLDAMENVEFKPFPITLNEIGLFNNNVLWAGVHESESLMKLVKRLRYELAKADIPFDNKCCATWMIPKVFRKPMYRQFQ